MTYGQAAAWIVARLAEALDCAFYRGVAHGDVKPSNILLSADGNPRLLDFNLARDWAGGAADADLADPGGTLAYMAPERLGDLAQSDRTESGGQLASSSGELEPGSAALVSRDPMGGALPTDPRPHLADIYSLGLVFLEALTGRPPDQIVFPPERDPSRRPALLQTGALALAPARFANPATSIRTSLTAAGYPPSSGLQSILARSLDPNPFARYPTRMGACPRPRPLAHRPAPGLRPRAASEPGLAPVGAPAPAITRRHVCGLGCRRLGNGRCDALVESRPSKTAAFQV